MRQPGKVFFLVFLTFLVHNVQSQTGCDAIGNYCMDNVNIQICEGSILDAGGGNAYPDANYTMTICPDNPGDVIQLNFSAFNLQTSPNSNNSDYLIIYDGNNTGAPSLGSYTGTSLQAVDVTGTIFNVTGCLTLVFQDNGNPNATNPGFECGVSCTTPCASPTSASEIVYPVPLGIEQSVSVCLNSPVTFADAGSYAEPGFTIEQYIWNFDDGTVDTTSGPNVSYLFQEPGEYIVSLTVEDNNGCQSLNVIPLQVLVSTIPLFPSIEDLETEYCLGEEFQLDAGEVENVTWTALPPQVVAGETYLADGAGFSYSSSLVFDFFEPGALLENCEDLLSIFVNMEHSYMGDLGVLIQCPDGTSVNLVEWGTNGGGGTYLGEAVDDESQTQGVGYDYYWSPEANNGTWGENAGGGATSLPSGTYESAQDICDLVGCPLNGEWTFTITDNLGADNGFIFAWGLNFNPSLYPGVTSFTPTVGMDADSSYWTGPFINSIDDDADIIFVQPTSEGSFEYTYTVVNSFGCQFDTTITITVTQSPLVSAGPDLLFGCMELELQGGWEDMAAPSCSVDGGTFDYCYGNSETFTWTFCPDDPGDGVTFMTFSFLSGQMEFFLDVLTIYDGEDTSSPILATWNIGDASGQSWTAANSTGCLTITFSSDGSISCADGFYNPWEYTVSCTEGSPQYVWEWTPPNFLSNPNIPSPTITAMSGTTLYTLTGYPIGHPDCGSSDQVLVTVPTGLEVVMPVNPQACPGETVLFGPTSIVEGVEPYSFIWTDDLGNTWFTEEIEVLVEEAANYCLTVSDQCGEQVTECATVIPFETISAAFGIDTTLACEPLIVQFEAFTENTDQVVSMLWNFDDGEEGSGIPNVAHEYLEGTYQPFMTLETIDGCIFSDTLDNPLIIFPSPLSSFSFDPEVAILPSTTFDFQNNSIDAGIYYWGFGEFDFSTEDEPSFDFPAEQTGQYQVYLIASNNFGCIDSSGTYVIVIDEMVIFAPNAFTPDGDGINDVWQIIGKGFADENFKLIVFDRWGNQVFSATTPHQSWTGNKDSRTHYVQNDVYPWILEVMDAQTGTIEKFTGTVTMIR
ncbi:MAG: PKD domain-containing protein [Flavobacteriales bacterium]|nr:PKD domain-containing protein [Flavobacteriales bacterium]